ncbi:MAG TPA: Yip1 family protein [Chloroflexota bacterium]
MALAASSASLPDRMMRAARLNVPLYEEVEADTTATTQALTVVVIVALASGIGSGIAASMNQAGGNFIGSLIGGIISALIGWAVWSFVIYFVGTRFFGGTATYGELLRTLGYAESPGVLSILAFIPVLGPIVGAVAGIWVLVASFIATRQALDISNGKTVGTIIVAIIALIIVLALISIVLAAIGLGAMAGAGLLGRP